jgi:hypothetical protein
MEDKVYRIWSVLSSFEESSAACISDMLLHVSNGAYVDGVFVAEKFIWHVEILFGSADNLDAQFSGLSESSGMPVKGMLYCFFCDTSRLAACPAYFCSRKRHKADSLSEFI